MRISNSRKRGSSASSLASSHIPLPTIEAILRHCHLVRPCDYRSFPEALRQDPFSCRRLWSQVKANSRTWTGKSYPSQPARHRAEQDGRLGACQHPHCSARLPSPFCFPVSAVLTDSSSRRHCASPGTLARAYEGAGASAYVQVYAMERSRPLHA